MLISLPKINANFTADDMRDKLKKLSSLLRKSDLEAAEYIISIASEFSFDRVSSEIAQRAQEVYKDWEQDPNGESLEYGYGGICDAMADTICNVLSDYEIECHSSWSDVDGHTSVIAKMPDGIYVVDIPPGVYEAGGWYSWQKKKDINIKSSDVTFDKLSSRPEDYRLYQD